MNLSFMWIDKQVPTTHPVTGIRGELSSAVKLLRLYGFDSIEIMAGDPFKLDLAELSLTGPASMKVVQLCTGEYFGTYGLCLNHVDSERREKAWAWAKQSVFLAGQLGCPINIGRFRGGVWSDGRDSSWERMAEGMRFLDNEASKQGVSVLIEPLVEDVCGSLNTLQEAINFINDVGLRSTFLMIDTDHTSLREEATIRENTSLIRLVHLSDTRHKMLGTGQVAFERYFRVLEEINYDGPLSVEVFPEGSDEEVVASSIRFLKRFLRLEESPSGWAFKQHTQ